jgi:hypothetical protein
MQECLASIQDLQLHDDDASASPKPAVAPLAGITEHLNRHANISLKCACSSVLAAGLESSYISCIFQLVCIFITTSLTFRSKCIVSLLDLRLSLIFSVRMAAITAMMGISTPLATCIHKSPPPSKPATCSGSALPDCIAGSSTTHPHGTSSPSQTVF